ncbi:MAG: multidrug transporter, partial [Bacteroidales bacterium]|nr:multidrug transporter [Bacteroidales bacterium]
MKLANKRIAKNTGFLYIRMLIIMGVTLFTSRVVLQSLGVVDYGLYNVVGGIVVMMSFVNNCAGGATSRFLTFSLGENIEADYRQIFSAAFYIHMIIAFAIVILGETVGLWYVTHKMIIPPERMGAALWVYQLSILSSVVSFTQVPYNASIIAAERLNVYAFVGIYEAIGKMVIAYAVYLKLLDGLKLYAILLFLLTTSVALFYRFYCVKHFGERCKITKVNNKRLYKKLISYSGWDLIGSFSGVARSQGVNLILNLFCGPVVNAARAVAYQVEGALYSFTNNFLMASRPAIIKHYAAGEIENMLDLLYNTAKFACLMFSCLAIPVVIESDFILKLWLVNPPENASLFLRIVLLNYLVISINNTINIGVHATGDVKTLNIYAGSKIFFEMPVIYFLLKNGFAPYWAFIVLISGSSFVVFVNLWVLKKNIKQFSFVSFFKKVFLRIGIIIVLPTIQALFLHFHIDNNIIR